MDEKLYGTAAHLREVFTEKGGVENYKAEIEIKAYLKIVILCVGANLLKAGLNKIENIKPKIDRFL